jgi:MFS superfamily sulfate permease-like transporter
MSTISNPIAAPRPGLLLRIAPGLRPLLAYRFGEDFRHDVVAGLCVASVAVPVAIAYAKLAGGDPQLFASLSIVLAFLAGVFCILASFFGLGALADFLSRPILVGCMNGVAPSILLSQIGKICGFHVGSAGIVRPLPEILSKLPQAPDAHIADEMGQAAPPCQAHR